MRAQTTKVFKSGNSMAIRLPKQFHIKGPEVEIRQRGDEIIIRETHKSLAEAFSVLGKLSDDFLSEGRKDTPPQKRDFD